MQTLKLMVENVLFFPLPFCHCLGCARTPIRRAPLAIKPTHSILRLGDAIQAPTRKVSAVARLAALLALSPLSCRTRAVAQHRLVYSCPPILLSLLRFLASSDVGTVKVGRIVPFSRAPTLHAGVVTRAVIRFVFLRPQVPSNVPITPFLFLPPRGIISGLTLLIVLPL